MSGDPTEYAYDGRPLDEPGQDDLIAVDHALTTLGRISGEIKIEYGQLMSGGGYCIFNDSAEVERIFPMADRIRSGQRFGGHVYRRRIVIIEDWDEVPR